MIESLSDSEKGIVAICRLNKLMPNKESKKVLAIGASSTRQEDKKKKWKFRGLVISYSRGSKSNLWGRFGGGWNWELGFVAGGSSIMFNFLVFSVMFSLRSRKETIVG